MNSATILLFVWAAQSDGAPLWTLDASRVFTLQRSGADDRGIPETKTSVLSLPNPFAFSAARVLAPGGQPVSVADGLMDIGQSQRLAEVASSLRGSHLRVAVVQGALAVGSGAVAVAGIGTAVLVGVLLAAPRWREVSGPPASVAPGSWPMLVVTGGVVVVTGLMGAAGLGAFLFTLRNALREGKLAVRTTPESAGQGDAWPTGIAADVVESHNRRVMGHAPVPGPEGEPTPEPETEQPVIIPS